MAEQTYELSADQYRELMGRLGPGYAGLDNGKAGVIAAGSDQRDAGRNAEAAMQRGGQGAAAIVGIQRNEFNPNRSKYAIATDDPRIREELKRMGVQPLPQPATPIQQLPPFQTQVGGPQENERRK